jgi:8-oxo-dGTP pyrophosphatase MutT (NUDIX family)
MPRAAALPAARTKTFLKTLADEFQLLFGRPPRVQFAALCYRRRKKKEGYKILLITSRGTGRWVTPKGWPMEGRTAAEVAEQEAFEEAGMRGEVAAEPIGHFTYVKSMDGGLEMRCIVQVHPLEVSEIEKNFPEKRQRQIAWFTPEEAAARVAEPELKAIIHSFDPSSTA